MVLLTITPSMVEGLTQLPTKQDIESAGSDVQSAPSLDSPSVGKSISHGQVVDLWKTLKSLESSSSSPSLEELLRGSQIYIPPPPPKPEPTPEYRALMARLRREEEARSYERMVNPSTTTRGTFQQRFPHSSSAAFASVNQPMSKSDLGDDDVTYNDVHRQLMLLINFAVSVLGVAGTLWVVARWWSVPARLFLTMGGSALVAIAEVAVYSIYVWKMGDEKQKQEAVKEVKEVVSTWVVGKDENGEEASDPADEKTILLKEKDEDSTDAVRKRLATGKEDDT